MASLLERRPSRWLIGAFRLPAPMFRRGMGWMFMGRLIMVAHTGRRTGRTRSTVLEVLRHDPDSQVWYVAAAWGDRADWFRNLVKEPAATVTAGRRQYPVTARVVPVGEATRILGAYVRTHPWWVGIMARMVGFNMKDPAVVADRMPVIALEAEARVGVTTDRATIAPVVTTKADTQATYDRIAPYYELLEGVWERRSRSAGISALRIRSGEKTLEIGSGPGYALAKATRLVGSEGMAVGLDLSANMCGLARRRLSRHGPSGSGFVVQGDGTRLPFADGRFDVAFMSFALELFDTPQIPVVLAELYRVLRSGGRIAIVALSKEEPAPVMQRGYEWGHRAFPKVVDCRPIHVAPALTEAGFVVETDQRFSIWGMPVAMVVGSRPAT